MTEKERKQKAKEFAEYWKDKGYEKGQKNIKTPRKNPWRFNFSIVKYINLLYVCSFFVHIDMLSLSHFYFLWADRR